MRHVKEKKQSSGSRCQWSASEFSSLLQGAFLILWPGTVCAHDEDIRAYAPSKQNTLLLFPCSGSGTAWSSKRSRAKRANAYHYPCGGGWRWGCAVVTTVSYRSRWQRVVEAYNHVRLNPAASITLPQISHLRKSTSSATEWHQRLPPLKNRGQLHFLLFFKSLCNIIFGQGHIIDFRLWKTEASLNYL